MQEGVGLRFCTDIPETDRRSLTRARDVADGNILSGQGLKRRRVEHKDTSSGCFGSTTGFIPNHKDINQKLTSSTDITSLMSVIFHNHKSFNHVNVATALHRLAKRKPMNLMPAMMNDLHQALNRTIN